MMTPQIPVLDLKASFPGMEIAGLRRSKRKKLFDFGCDFGYIVDNDSIDRSISFLRHGPKSIQGGWREESNHKDQNPTITSYLFGVFFYQPNKIGGDMLNWKFDSVGCKFYFLGCRIIDGVVKNLDFESPEDLTKELWHEICETIRALAFDSETLSWDKELEKEFDQVNRLFFSWYLREPKEGHWPLLEISVRGKCTSDYPYGDRDFVVDMKHRLFEREVSTRIRELFFEIPTVKTEIEKARDDIKKSEEESKRKVEKNKKIFEEIEKLKNQLE